MLEQILGLLLGLIIGFIIVYKNKGRTSATTGAGTTGVTGTTEKQREEAERKKAKAVPQVTKVSSDLNIFFSDLIAKLDNLIAEIGHGSQIGQSLKWVEIMKGIDNQIKNAENKILNSGQSTLITRIFEYVALKNFDVAINFLQTELDEEKYFKGYTQAIQNLQKRIIELNSKFQPATATQKLTVKILKPEKNKEHKFPIGTEIQELRAIAEGPGSEEINSGKREDIWLKWEMIQGSRSYNVGYRKPTTTIRNSDMVPSQLIPNTTTTLRCILIDENDKEIDHDDVDINLIHLPEINATVEVVKPNPSKEHTYFIGNIVELEAYAQGEKADEINSGKVEFVGFIWRLEQGKGYYSNILHKREGRSDDISERLFNEGEAMLRCVLFNYNKNKIIHEVDIKIMLKKKT